MEPGFRDGLIYRLMPPVEWDMAVASGHLPYNAHDERDGFMHLSAPHQVLETANKHYTVHMELMAAGIDPDVLGDMLKWEASRGGDLFPHAYGFVPTEAVVHRLAVRQNKEGRFVVVEAAG